jgi:hypothetical protein
MIESSPGGGRREGLEALVNACIRHRALPLAESVAAIVSQLVPGSVEDDLLLLGCEVGL